MRTLFIILCLYVTLLAMLFWAWADRAHAHDVYGNLRDPSGQLCCGGDPVTGDCEPMTYEDTHENPDGSWTFESRRYKVSVLVSEQKITWLPVAGSDDPVHWCGVPRTKVYLAPINGENPDPTFWTYCAFIAPGGV